MSKIKKTLLKATKVYKNMELSLLKIEEGKLMNRINEKNNELRKLENHLDKVKNIIQEKQYVIILLKSIVEKYLFILKRIRELNSLLNFKKYCNR
ncbi:MAG: hypothetical protein KAH13_05160 [Tenericutes bacterium]|nr:hypothetical protein [Mycoplasmatota bacterium]